MTNISINFDCSPCGRSWSYTDVPIASAELITEWYDRHKHTPEELRAFYSYDHEDVGYDEDD